jgi:hypothetical protein
MSATLVPWDVSPELQRERLILLAQEVARARDRIADLHEPENGDDPWSFGCRAYSRTCHGLQRLEESNKYPWLRTTRRGLSFTLFVDGVPLKFYRGDADQPNSRTLKSGLDETLRAKQARLPFYDQEIAPETDGWSWLMAIDTDADGRTLQVNFLQANRNGETKNIFAAGESIGVLASVDDIRPEGVEQEPATIGVPGDDIGNAVIGEDDDDL